MEKKIAIIGGDSRIVNLAKIMSKDGLEIDTYALEKATELEKSPLVHNCHSLDEATANVNTVITSIPLSKEEGYIYAPYSDIKVAIEDIRHYCKGKKLISGALPDTFKNDTTLCCYDILEIEEYAIFNAIATAEGAIQVAMEEFPKTLSGSGVLVMGFGRIGKVLAKMLQGIGAKVYCEARKKTDLAYIKAYGYTPVPLEDFAENLHQYDVIINTIPVRILNSSMLDKIKQETLIIDLSSKPGGVDFEYAKKKKIKTIWALALPGKVAPESAAEYIKNVINTIEKEGKTKEREK